MNGGPSVAVIGGSGIYQLEGIEIIEELEVSTPYGRPSDKIVRAKVEGNECFFLPRHGRSHNLLPHEVNYCANIYALKSLGVKIVISVSAVGSLKEELSPRTLFFPDQFIDWTKGVRRRSFFGQGIVAHVSTANPIDHCLKEILYRAACENEIKSSMDGAYLCIEGPQFSSKAESEIYRSFGASVIGMTNVPEAYLAKEAGMAYSTVAMVTDYDCWKEEHCSVDEIMKVMKDNNLSAQKLLKTTLKNLSQQEFYVETENEVGIMTPKDSLSPSQREILDVLLK